MNDRKIAFIFPGQGAQKVGMGKELFDNFKCFRDVFDTASNVLGYDIKKLVYEANDDINKTIFTQPAILTVELATLSILKELGVKASLLAGYSLGEYACLVASGVISIPDAMRLISLRAKYMQEDGDIVPGAMAAVIGLTGAEVEKIISGIPDVWIANYNTEKQVSISGKKEGVDRASEKLKEAGARRVIPVNVSGAFHTELLARASERFSKDLEGIKISTPKIPYYTNVTGEKVESSDGIPELLSRQIKSPVR